jgi:hypothetical protein
MSSENAGRAAFASAVSEGLSKREYFAGRAMAAMCSQGWPNDADAPEIARRSVVQADALLAELAK